MNNKHFHYDTNTVNYTVFLLSTTTIDSIIIVASGTILTTNVSNVI